MGIMRIERVDDGWLVTDNLGSRRVADISEIPAPERDKLAVLLTAPVGFRDGAVGRRIKEDIFWIFHDKEKYERELREREYADQKAYEEAIQESTHRAKETLCEACDRPISCCRCSS